MRAINHALTGAVIGLAVDNPEISMPSALFSHLVCDAIPHHGLGEKSEKDIEDALKSKTFRNTLILDAFLCFLLVVLLLATQPRNWLVACVCAFLAASPDFLSFRRYISVKRGTAFKQTRLEKFLSDIQWFERPSGAIVEVAWFVVFSGLILTFIR